MKKATMFIAAGIGLAVGLGSAVAGKPKPSVVTPIEKAQFTLMDTNNPNSMQVALLSGDMKKGPVVALLKIKPGQAPIHSHSSDYHATLIQGEAKHWDDGKEGEAVALQPGSYWFQPGKQFHGDACTAKTGECLVFVHILGKFDFIPKPEPKK